MAPWLAVALVGAALTAGVTMAFVGRPAAANPTDVMTAVTTGAEPAVLAAKPHSASDRLSPLTQRTARQGLYVLAAAAAALLAARPATALGRRRGVEAVPLQPARRPTLSRAPPRLLLTAP